MVKIGTKIEKCEKFVRKIKKGVISGTKTENNEIFIHLTAMHLIVSEQKLKEERTFGKDRKDD